MKHILFFSSQGMEDTSGFGRCFPIAKELSRRGYRITVLALHADYPSLENRRLTKAGVDVLYVGQMHVLKRGNKKYYFNKFKLLGIVFLSTLKMCYWGLRIKADILWCFKPQPVNGTAALITKIFKKKPLLLDCDDYEASARALNKVERFIFSVFESTVPRLAQKITHNTFFIKDHLVGKGCPSNRFIYVPDGIDWDRLTCKRENQTEELREQLGFKHKKVVLYFGSISMNFGHAVDLALKAFPFVKEQIPESKLLVVGGGDAFDIIRDLIPAELTNDIVLTGRVSFEDLPAFLRLADISIDPIREDLSNKGRFGLKIIESIALGIPVVTSDIGDRKIVLKYGKAGSLVQADDEKALAEGIVRILKDERLRREMSDECHQLAKKYQWDSLVDKIISQTACLRSP